MMEEFPNVYHCIAFIIGISTIKADYETEVLKHSPDWTGQGGMVQSHCHEQYPSDGENHFVLQTKYWRISQKCLTTCPDRYSCTRCPVFE